MRKVTTCLGIIALFFLFFGYILPYMQFHYTEISDEEIVISRIGMIPFNRTKYAVNLETGDEKIVVSSLFGNYQSIEYDGECQCIDKVYKHGDYALSLWDNGMVYEQRGEMIKNIIPYEDARERFEEALAIRLAFREKYSIFFSKMQTAYSR